MSRIFLTGASGFIGSHLSSRFKKENIHFEPFTGDLTSFESVAKKIKDGNYETIVHLAGISNFKDCESKPDKAFSVNVTGTINLLEALLREKKKVRFIFTSTAHVYHISGDHVTINEDSTVQPKSIYGRSKLLAEKVIEEYFQKYDLGQAIVFRLFNHTHKTQTGPYFFSELLYQINNLKSSSNEEKEVRLGNLFIQRDFSLVSDLVELIMKAVTKKIDWQYNIFNVCSGNTYQLSELVTSLFKHLDENIKVIEDKSKARANDPIRISGNNQKTKYYFNWHPLKRDAESFINEFLKNV
jgi:GDP-4-dehydro-6-deoxy-D-mannose reductase